MKCPYCGGEMQSLDVKCPFCGREHQEGIAFNREVQEKEERNRKLLPTILRKNANWLTHKLTSRIIIIMAVVDFLLLVVGVSITAWSDRDSNREPEAGSQAHEYVEKFKSDDYYHQEFVWSVNRVMDKLETGEELEDFDLERLVEDSYDLARKKEDFSKDERDRAEMLLQAFYRGYLGFSEEEASFLQPDDNGEYAYWLSDEQELMIKELILEKVKVN